MDLDAWAARHRISAVALAELKQLLVPPTGGLTLLGSSESAVQSQVRLEASRKGCRLWRNNVGAGYLADGSFIRWGLCNDSTVLNKSFKSGDLIGIRSVVITPADIGRTIGQFMSREVKAAGWKLGNSDRELAQVRWAQMVNAMGGDAAFATGEGTV